LRAVVGVVVLTLAALAVWAATLMYRHVTYENRLEETKDRVAIAQRPWEDASEAADVALGIIEDPDSTDAAVEFATADLRAARTRIDETRLPALEAEAAYDALERDQEAMPIRWWIFAGSATGALLVVTVGLVYYRSEKRRQFENHEIVTALSRSSVRSGDPFDLTDRWLDNQVQLKNYHQLVLNYASSTRQTTLATLVVGFAFLVAIGFLAVSARDIPAAIASSVVAAAAAAVTGFIARAVLRNADTSSREMLSFFSHPLEVQRILAAERIARGMSETSQASAYLLIVGALTRQDILTNATSEDVGGNSPARSGEEQFGA
jgi:hypothetical protein